jgi:hypothetical protein
VVAVVAVVVLKVPKVCKAPPVVVVLRVLLAFKVS